MASTRVTLSAVLLLAIGGRSLVSAGGFLDYRSGHSLHYMPSESKSNDDAVSACDNLGGTLAFGDEGADELRAVLTRAGVQRAWMDALLLQRESQQKQVWRRNLRDVEYRLLDSYSEKGAGLVMDMTRGKAKGADRRTGERFVCRFDLTDEVVVQQLKQNVYKFPDEDQERVKMVVGAAETRLRLDNEKKQREKQASLVKTADGMLLQLLLQLPTNKKP